MILIPARNPSPWTGPAGNNTYLLTGAVAVLIDAGTGVPEHLDEIARTLAGEPLGAILITHGHPDHAAGIPALLARWPAARVIRYPDEGAAPIPAGDRHLLPIRTPGHAPDHLCFLDPDSRDLYCGDLIRSGGSIVIPASQGGDVRQYLDSLRRVRGLAPRRLLPGHDWIVDDPAPLINHFIRHRLEREAQVAAAVRAGLTTAEAIAASLYPGLPESLRHAAIDTVQAHLLKLEAERPASNPQPGTPNPEPR